MTNYCDILNILVSHLTAKELTASALHCDYSRPIALYCVLTIDFLNFLSLSMSLEKHSRAAM